MNIRFVPRQEIELLKWNGCVHYAPNGRIYGYSWYLDNVAEHWDGLVEGDYESVFPLTWNTKLLGYKQLYQPLLCQQLGLFSVNVCSSARLQKFLNAIPREFRYANISLNDSNGGLLQLPDIQTSTSPNHVIYLNKDYDDLRRNYSDNAKRNIKKAGKHPLYFSTDLRPEAFVEQVRLYHAGRGTGIPDALYHAALRIIYNSMHRGLGFMAGVFDAESKELLAAIFFLVSAERLINLLNVTTPRGKEIGAMHYLLDVIIQQNAGRPKILDFEGSSIPSIARFYESFGAENLPYFKLSYNRLPWWLRLVKK